jgi:hypothetical protein
MKRILGTERGVGDGVLTEITTRIYLKKKIFFDQLEEKDLYYNFLGLHLTKKNGNAEKKDDNSRGQCEKFFDGVACYDRDRLMKVREGAFTKRCAHSGCNQLE